jgi:3-hydroxyacyl-[acyl-carrier-protein] dehydratase
MVESWQRTVAPVQVTSSSEEGGVSAAKFSLRIPEDLPELAAHFPGYPIYPGVFFLDCVEQALAQWLGDALEMLELRSLRLLAPVFPLDELSIDITLERPSTTAVFHRGTVRVAVVKQCWHG